MKTSIRVQNLIKHYHGAAKPSVDGISLEVPQGELFAFLGPNGAGKTTTVSILNTTLSKTSGEVEIAGYNLDTNPNEVRQNIGVIFQNPSLDKNLTAEENIRFHAVLYGLYPYRPVYSFMPESYRKQVEKLAGMIGLDDNLHQPIKTFSGGMKRKLEIIRGLIHEPKVLFLDEPTTGLDPLSRKNFWDYLQTVKTEKGMTVFLTTHYLDEAESADRVAIIQNGKIILQGTPKHVKSQLLNKHMTLDTHQKDRETLRSELQKAGKEVSESGPFIVKIDSVPDAQRLLQKLKTELTDLEIHAPTLEEAYLEVIGEDKA